MKCRCSKWYSALFLLPNFMPLFLLLTILPDWHHLQGGQILLTLITLLCSFIRKVLMLSIYPLSPEPMQLLIWITHAVLIKSGNFMLHIFFLNYFPTAHIPACFGWFGKFMQSQSVNKEHCWSVMWTESPSTFYYCLVTYKHFLTIFWLDKLGGGKKS